jgi:hypothetical protein
MRLFLIILFVSMTTSRASADSELQIGLKSGLSSATLAHDNRADRLGVSAGLTADLQWSLSERLALAGQLGVLYTPRGADVVVDGTSIGNIRQHYLDIALLARPGLRVGPVMIYVLLGGGLSVLAHATSEDATGMSQDVTSDLRRLDITLLAGAGLALPLPRSALRLLQLSAIFLEVRHDQGMIDIDMANGGFKNRTNSIMLGLSFALTARPSTVPLTQSAQSSH